MRGHRLGRQQACQEMAATERSFNVEKNTEIRVRCRAPRKQLMMNCHQLSIHPDDFTVEPAVCHERLSFGSTISLPGNGGNGYATQYGEEHMSYEWEKKSTKSTVHEELPPTQQPSVMTSQQSAVRGHPLGRQEICQGRSQGTRRQGEYADSDGARAQRTFIRVLNKRF